MASSAVLYTTGIMEKVSAHTGGSLPIGNAFDFNPDTYFESPVTPDRTIEIDFNQVVTVDQFAMWIHNYNTDYDDDTQTITVQSDDNDDGNYTSVTNFGAIAFDNTVGDPIYIPFVNPTPTSKRYWRILLTNMSIIAEASMFLFLRKRILAVGNQYPEDDWDDFATREVMALGGRKFVQGVNRNRLGGFTRKFLLNGTTDFQALQNAYRDSHKNRFPLIYEEGSIRRFVRFTNQPFSQALNDYQLYEPEVQFELVPYIADGESY
jgi:hypothetical protein